MQPNYRLRCYLCYILIIILLFSLGATRKSRSELEYEIESLNLQIDGLKQRMDEATSVTYEEHYEIDDMNPNDILKYLEDCWMTTLYPLEEVYDVYVLGFQRGYEAKKKGKWNDTIDEYINGYYFSETDPLYSLFE